MKQQDIANFERRNRTLRPEATNLSQFTIVTDHRQSNRVVELEDINDFMDDHELSLEQKESVRLQNRLEQLQNE